MNQYIFCIIIENNSSKQNENIFDRKRGPATLNKAVQFTIEQNVNIKTFHKETQRWEETLKAE